MAKASRARQRGARTARRRSGQRSGGELPPAAGEAIPAAPMIDETRHRFPWPARPEQRYGVESPYLAVVNARGPWAVWRHGAANPPFIPLCLDLLDKEFWQRADNGQRVFALTVWMQAAREDDWGIVWGDPVRLCTQWRLDPATFTPRLEWMIGAGLACYLTQAEAEAVRNWCPERAQRGGNTRGGQEQAKTSQAKQSQGPAVPADSQNSFPSASAQQIPESKGQGKQAEHSKPESSKSQAKPEHGPQAQPEGTEPANLPESDHGAGGGSPRTTGGVRGRTHNPRPPSVSDAQPIGDLLGWGNPAAVEFGRGMYEAIMGHVCPQDLMAASDQVKADVGVWVHYWVTQVERSLSTGQHGDFMRRCWLDVGKKRKVRSIKNLGAVARKRIVPGVLRSMAYG